MTDKYKIVFIGPISPPVTGPGVKNKELIDSFKRHGIELIEINSLGWIKKIFNFFFIVIKNSIKYKHVVLSISKKGRFTLIPLMYILNILFDVKYMLLPAGGNLDKEINKALPIYKLLFIKSLKKSSKIYVESKSLRDGLKNLKINNVEYMPNPRRNLNFKWKYNQSKEKHIIFLSKIKPEKGVVLLIEAAKILISTNKHLKFLFYGPIDPLFEDKFYLLIKETTFIHYQGISKPDQVQEILSKADLFILPTMWKNEGLPGVLVEASFSGVPMIISRFRASEEFIENEINGIIIEPGSVDEIVNSISRLLNSENLLNKLSNNFKKLSAEFDVDIHIKKIISDMHKYDWKINDEKS